MDADGLTDERVEARRFDLAMRRLLAGDLTEAEAVELDKLNATANVTCPTPEPPEVTAAMDEAERIIEIGRRVIEERG